MTVAVKWIGSPNYFPNRLGHNPNWTPADPATWIVLHTTVSTRDSAASRFTSPNGGASPTYMVDLDGSIYQYVKETDGPWTDGVNDGVGSNLDSITIEHVDNKDYNGPRTPELYEASAQLVADIAKRRGIPLIHRGAGGGVIGHRECQQPGGQTACPDGLDLGRIISRAIEINNPPPPVPVPPPVPPVPDWQKNLKPNVQSFTLYSPVAITNLADGTVIGSVPPGPLDVAFETTAFQHSWWATSYGAQHGHGLHKEEVATASTPPVPAPPPQPVPPAPVPDPVNPVPPDPPVPLPAPHHGSWQEIIADWADHELLALIDWLKNQHTQRQIK